MAIIGNTYIQAGTKPTATELNKVYDDMASTTVVDDNTMSRWATREHLNVSTSSLSFNTLYNKDYDGTTLWTIPSTSWTTINNSGVDATQVLPNYVTTRDTLVRVQASGLIASIVIDPTIRDGNGTSGQTNYNTYSFRIFATLNGGANTIDIANCTYSLTQKAIITHEQVSASDRKPIAYRSFGFSGLTWIASGNLIDKIELQALVGNASQTVNIEHNHLHVILAEV